MSRESLNSMRVPGLVPAGSWPRQLVCLCVGFLLFCATTAFAGGAQPHPDAARLFANAGFGDKLRPCETMQPQQFADCTSLHSDIARIVEAITVSRREHAKWFIASYIAGRFDRLIECLETTCDGLFVVEDRAGPQWATRWRQMLRFQACIHAIPAIKDEKTDFGYAASYRLDLALAGGVPECSPMMDKSQDSQILKKFNLHGVF